MAPALTTSKRKFYRLLEGISASPSTATFYHTHNRNSNSTQSTADAPTSHDSQSPSRTAKRARIADRDRPSTPGGQAAGVDSPAPSRMLQGTPSVRLVTSTDRRKELGLADVSEVRLLPNYAPWSDDQFLVRLKTFADIKIWPPKPDMLDEVQWAKRGWVCDGVNTVSCNGCNGRLVIQLKRPSKSESIEDWATEFDEALLKKYADMIVSGHDERCLWRAAGCKDDIFRIRMGDVPSRNDGIRSRYESLLQISDSLPDTLLAPPTLHRIHPAPNAAETFDLQSFLSHARRIISPSTISSPALTEVPRTPTIESGPTGDHSINTTAFALAVFGWSGTTSYGIPMSTCSHCFVRNGMWLYSKKTALISSPRSQRLQKVSNSGSKSDQTLANSSCSSPENKGDNNDDDNDDSFNFELDLLHREYCPWRNGSSQCGVGQFSGLAGWEILVNTVLDQATARSHTREALKSGASVVGGGDGGQVPGSPAVAPQVPESPASTVSTTFSTSDAKERRRLADQQDQVRMSRFRKLREALGIKRSSKPKAGSAPLSPTG